MDGRLTRFRRLAGLATQLAIGLALGLPQAGCGTPPQSTAADAAHAGDAGDAGDAGVGDAMVVTDDGGGVTDGRNDDDDVVDGDADADGDGGGDGDGDGADTGDDGGSADATVSAGRMPAAAYAGALNLASFQGSRTAWASALAVHAGVVVAVNPDSDSISVLDEATLTLSQEISVGHDPRTAALSIDGRYAVVVNRGDGTASLVDLLSGREQLYWDIGPMPYGVAIVGTRIFVTEEARGQVVVLDVADLPSLTRIAAGDTPAGIATCVAPRCALPGTATVLVSHFYSGALATIDPTTLAVGPSLPTGADTNLSQFIAISPDGSRAYLPQTRSNADNPNRQFDTTVFPVVNVVQLAPPPSPPLRLLNAERVTLDTADRPIAMPFAADLSPDGATLWVANAASDNLSVIDLPTLHKVAHIDVGANPRAVVLASGGSQALVNETLDGTLAVIDTATFAIVRRVALTHLSLDPTLLRGKRLFHSSARADVARDQWMACATCHFDALTDRRTWRSFPDGPRNTTALFNLADTLPMHWSGDLDEVEDVEATIRFVQAGTGLTPLAHVDTLGPPLAGLSDDLDALAAFIRAIPAPRSPFSEDGAAIARGQATFARLGCATCHPAPRYTDRQRHDVGTGDAALEHNGHGYGTAFDTPSLRALWLTPPYFHDGSAATLSDTLARAGTHDAGAQLDASELADLVTFLMSL